MLGDAGTGWEMQELVGACRDMQEQAGDAGTGWEMQELVGACRDMQEQAGRCRNW